MSFGYQKFIFKLNCFVKVIQVLCSRTNTYILCWPSLDGNSIFIDLFSRTGSLLFTKKKYSRIRSLKRFYSLQIEASGWYKGIDTISSSSETQLLTILEMFFSAQLEVDKDIVELGDFIMKLSIQLMIMIFQNPSLQDFSK